MMVHQDSVETSPIASSSVNSDHDSSGSHIDPLPEPTDLYTSDIENLDRDTESLFILLTSATSQSSTSEDLSSPDVSHRTSVEAPNTARQRSRPLPLRLSLPFNRGFYFPREDATTWLETLLFQESSREVNRELKQNATTVAVLHGMAGVGKTQIALNFARSAQSRFDAVFWVRSDSKQSVLQSFHDIAIALGLVNGRRHYSHTQSAGLVMKWLARPETRWLLIFDNADEADIIVPYVSYGKSGTTIITTRTAGLQLPGGISPAFHHVQPLSVSDSQSFLLQSTHLLSKDVNSKPGLELIKDLGGLPIALTLTAKYIRRNKLGIEEYLSQCGGEKHQKCSSKRPPLQSIVDMTHDARQLLSALSYMDPNAAPTSLVRAAFQESLLLHKASFTGQERFRVASEELLNLGLIQGVEDGNVFDDAYRIHRLIQDLMRDDLSQDEACHTLRACTSVLAAQWPSDRKFQNVLHGFWAGFDDVMNNLWRVTDHVSSVVLYMDTLDEYVDESFSRTALGCVWYVASSCATVGSSLTWIGTIEESARITRTTAISHAVRRHWSHYPGSAWEVRVNPYRQRRTCHDVSSASTIGNKE
jgi:hypothetical protein